MRWIARNRTSRNRVSEQAAEATVALTSISILST